MGTVIGSGLVYVRLDRPQNAGRGTTSYMVGVRNLTFSHVWLHNVLIDCYWRQLRSVDSMDEN